MRLRCLTGVMAVLMGLGVAGCGREPGPDAVATVNGEPILRKAFDARLKVRLLPLKTEERRGPTADDQSRMRKQVLDALIGRQLLVQAARRVGEAILAEEVDAAVEALLRDLSGARTATGQVTTPLQNAADEGSPFVEALRKHGITVAEFRADVEANLLARRFAARLIADVTADETEARRYYETHTPKFNQPAQYRLRLILAASESEAKAVATDIRRRNTTFEREAKRRATGILEGVRGEMGWVDLAALPSDLARVVAGLRPGEFGGPVVGKESVYLVQLVEKREAVELSFEKIKQDLVHVVRQEKRAAKVREWISRERATARIVLAGDLR